MGTCRMGRSPRDSVVDAAGESWELPGLYVADASLFPLPESARSALHDDGPLCIVRGRRPTLRRSNRFRHVRRASSSKGCVGHARTTSAGSQGRMTCPWDWEPHSAGGEPRLRPRCPGAGCPRRGAGAHALRAFVGTGQPVGWRGASGYMSGALGLLNHWLDSDDVRCARATAQERVTRFQPRTCRTTSSGPMGQSLWHGALGSTPNDHCCCTGLPGSTMRRGRGIASVKLVVRNRSRSQRIAI